MSAAFEQFLAFLAAQLSQPVQQQEEKDGIVLIGGDPPEVVIRVTKSHVTISEYAIRWEGPHTGSVAPIRIGSVWWDRLPEEDAMRAAKALMVVARNVRLTKFQTCRMCEQRTPPEWLHREEVCQGCAEGELGVVH